QQRRRLQLPLLLRRELKSLFDLAQTVERLASLFCGEPDALFVLIDYPLETRGGLVLNLADTLLNEGGMFLKATRLLLRGGDRLFHAPSRQHLLGDIQRRDEQHLG